MFDVAGPVTLEKLLAKEPEVMRNLSHWIICSIICGSNTVINGTGLNTSQQFMKTPCLEFVINSYILRYILILTTLLYCKCFRCLAKITMPTHPVTPWMSHQSIAENCLGV